jgi:hypothetical protein
MSNAKIYLCLLLQTTVTTAVLCQESSALKQYAQSVHFNYKVGFLLAHRESMAHLANSHFQSYELTYNFSSRGYQDWEQALNYPQFGITGLMVFNKNKMVLGNAFGIAGRIGLPKLTFGKNSKWKVKNDISLGLSYLERKFHVLENPKNIAIGTHINLLFLLGTEVQYTSEIGIFNLGIDFTHFSNGGTVKPNLGLNIPSVRIGMAWNTKVVDYNFDRLTYHRAHLSLLLFGALSAKNNYEFQNRLFPVFSSGVHMSRAMKKKYLYTYGIDITFNEANRHFLASSPDQTVISTFQVGVYNSWELDINKFAFGIGMGVYVYSPYKPFGVLYHRIGGRYHFSKNWYFHGYVRSHWAKADFFESGFGYKIPLK